MVDVAISNKDIYDLLQTVLKKSDSIENQIKLNKEELQQGIYNIHTEIKSEIQSLKQDNEELKEENKKLKNRLLVTERNLRRYNLVIYGLKEGENKNEDINVLINLINDKLTIDCRYGDIRDSHRIGKQTQGKNRPVVLEFINYQLKFEILTNAKKLKGTGLFISNDYISEDYHQRKVLQTNLKAAREKNLEAYIKNNKLIINGETYSYEELKDKQFQVEDEQVEEEQVGEQEGETIRSETNTSSNSPKQIAFKQVTRKRKEQPTDVESLLKRSNRLKNK